MQVHPDEYWNPDSPAYTIYQYGDVIYFVGAVVYVICAFRDDGWFWWMPAAGRVGWDYVELPKSGANSWGNAAVPSSVELTPATGATSGRVPDWPKDTTMIAASQPRGYGTVASETPKDTPVAP